MTHRQSFLQQPPTGTAFALPSPFGWGAIVGVISLTTLLILAGAGKLVNFVFPATALATGAFLYFRSPVLYVGFTWWVWFLAPFVRRLADWRGSFTEPSPVLLTPYLVTLVALITLWQNLPKIHRQGGGPFVLAVVALGYSFWVGLIYKSPVVVGIGLIDWLAPLTFGFYLFVNWRHYPQYRRNFQRVFVWGVLVMGVYGIIQYFFAPEWDVFWRAKAEFMSAGGHGNETEIRVWSTLNSPGPFAVTMMAGLLMLFNYEGVLLIPAWIAGYLGFLLSLVRSAWGGWFVGLLALIVSLKAKLQMRLVIVTVVMFLCLMPLLSIDTFSDVIYGRLESFSNLESDGSAQNREYYFVTQINDALTSWTGEGLGGKLYDWGIFSLLFKLGWLGTIFYLGGLLLLLLKLFQGHENRADPFIGVARSVAIATFAMVPLQTPFTEIKGMILWGFIGIGLAGKKYYRYQKMSTSALTRS